MPVKQEQFKKITLKELNQLLFLDPKHEVAKHATKQLWGQGYDFSIVKDDKNQDEMIEKVKKALKQAGFDGVIRRNENAMSKHGIQINTIEKNKGGELRIGEADTRYRSRVSKIEIIDDISAIVWKKFAYDDIQYVIIEKWDRYKKISQLSANGESVSIQGFNSQVPKELQIQETWQHNLGILPVFMFKNFEAYIEGSYEELADDYSVRNIPRAINQTFITEIKEQLLDTTRVFGNFTKAQLKNLKAKGVSYDSQLIAQLFIHVPQRTEAAGKMVEIQQAQLNQLAPLIEIRKANIKAYWEGCGYTYLLGDEPQPTNASTLFSKGKDIETTKEKRSIRQEQYTEFIKRFMVAMNLIDAAEMNEYEVIFQINENVVQSQDQIIDAELRLVDAGLQTKAMALSKIRDLRLEEAKAQIEEASKEQDEEQQKRNSMIMEMQGDEETPTDEAAPTEEPNNPTEAPF